MQVKLFFNGVILQAPNQNCVAWESVGTINVVFTQFKRSSVLHPIDVLLSGSMMFKKNRPWTMSKWSKALRPVWEVWAFMVHYDDNQLEPSWLGKKYQQLSNSLSSNWYLCNIFSRHHGMIEFWGTLFIIHSEANLLHPINLK